MALQTITLFLLFCSAVSAEKYVMSTMYTVTQVSCQPEFTAVTVVNEQQITRFDSENNTMIYTQDWVKNALLDYHANNYSQVHLSEYARLQKELIATMKSLGHTDSVHTFQRRSGCEWDDRTSHVQGFDEYGYDGEDFISLNLSQMRYIPHTPLAKATAERWNSDNNLLESQRHYYNTDCSNWLKRIGKVNLKKTGNITFYQKKAFSPVVCHVTGFCPKAMKISWRKNGRETTQNVSIGAILRDDDGTYLRDISIFSSELDISQFACVVGDNYKNLSMDSLKKTGTNSSTRKPKPESVKDTGHYVPIVIFATFIPIGLALIVGSLVLYFKCRRSDRCRTNGERSPADQLQPLQTLQPLQQTEQDCEAL